MTVLKRCKRCGVPTIMGRDHIWTSDGTIVIPSDRTFRMIFLEQRTLVNVLKELRGMFGGAIDNIVLESKRIRVRHYIDGVLKGPLGALVRHGIGSKKVYEEITKTALTLGFGRATVDGYKRKEYVIGHVENPYAMPLFAGDVAGVFESVEGVYASTTWREKGNVGHVKVEASDEPGYLEHRLKYKEKIIPGKRDVEKCPRCQAPEALGEYKWHEDKGIITHGRKRVLMMGMKDLNGVFLELQDAVGGPVRKTIQRVNYDQGRAFAKGGKAIEDFLDLMPVWGWGNPVRAEISDKEKRAEIRIENPFNQDFIVPRLKAMFASRFGGCEIEVSTGEGWIEAAVEGK